MRACNAAANHAAAVAFERKISNKIALQKLIYTELRERFGLSAQQAVRAIAKACGAYKRDKKIQPTFKPLGAIEYDRRIMSWKGREAVSLLTMRGRIIVPVVYQGRWLGRHPERIRGNADLIYRDGMWFVAIVIDVPEPPQGPEPVGWVGVDRGIVNLATDSDGTNYSGKTVRAVRYRYRMLRKRLQTKGTKSAKRLLKRRRRKEARFARDVNHRIAKALVSKVKDTGRGLKFEDLSGIRDRVTVRKTQRADLGSWAFDQLLQFVVYKARIAGVPLALVDPRNTSRQCPKCGHTSKKNRPARDWFCCESCGFAGPADHIAAMNIRGRAHVMVPHAA
jgi:putative transposase